MTKLKVIYLPSVQHTGTNFLSALVTNLCGGRCSLYQSELHGNTHYIKVSAGYTKAGRGVRYKVSSPADVIKIVMGIQAKRGGVGLLRNHVSGAPFPSDEYSLRLASVFPTCSPLREPLQACVSARVRNPDVTEFSASVNGFHLLALMRQWDSAQTFFLPVDLLASRGPGHRRDWVVALAKFLDIRLSDWTVMDKIIEAWNPIGTWKRYKNLNDPSYAQSLESAYRSGNTSYLMQEMPGAFKGLSGVDQVVKPFLESFGYKKFMW